LNPLAFLWQPPPHASVSFSSPVIGNTFNPYAFLTLLKCVFEAGVKH
jgi:hypothetical protein